MNSLLLTLAISAGQTPDDELELARAAVAVELAKLSLKTEVDSGVVVAPAADPRGEWSPWWDGVRWQPRWVQKEVSRPATPFPVTTPAIPAPLAAGASSSWPGSTRTVLTITGAATTGPFGDTNCPPYG